MARSRKQRSRFDPWQQKLHVDVIPTTDARKGEPELCIVLVARQPGSLALSNQAHEGAGFSVANMTHLSYI
jgi:hypothetical protein